MTDKNWRQVVEVAEHYKAIGQDEVYLAGDNDGDYPWEYVTGVRPGGSHRLDMDTGIWLSADHPSGIGFRWTFDIEPMSASGSGSYQIDVAAVEQVFRMLPEPAQRKLAEYLAGCAEKVAARGREYMGL